MTIANTTHGKVRGALKLGCLQFRGIPFASPPVGELRWQPPRPAPKWDGVRDATEFGPICPQNVGTMEAMGGVGRAAMPPMSEDCLTLNVWTPAADDALRPVMVWIHGGAFSTGSGRTPWYSGHNFARDGIVVVTVNYRLNAFGFLNLDGLFDGFEGTGTIGIRDQIAALEWVRDNIANFGGDPSNVTIFGESAGGMSVGTLLASPKAKGLFTKAIPQSGAAHNSHPAQDATKIAEQFLAMVDVAKGDTDALLALSVEQILDAAAGLAQTDVARLPYQPCVGDDVTPVAPIEALRKGVSSEIATLVGTCREEWKLFALGMRDGQPLPRMRPELQAAYTEKLGSPSEVELFSAIQTDRIFRIPAIRLAEAQVGSGAPAWMYRFDWPSPAMDGRLGACHALEIPFVFDNIEAPGVNVFTGGAAPQKIATEVHDAWVSFARDGDPGWTAYDTSKRATKLFDLESRVVDDPDGDTRVLWEGVL
jgi:para-nitrobenzyl esterase